MQALELVKFVFTEIPRYSLFIIHQFYYVEPLINYSVWQLPTTPDVKVDFNRAVDWWDSTVY